MDIEITTDNQKLKEQMKQRADKLKIQVGVLIRISSCSTIDEFVKSEVESELIETYIKIYREALNINKE